MRLPLVLAVVAACGGKSPTTTPTAGPVAMPRAPAGEAPSAAASEWTAKLGDPAESQRAVTELESLGDPTAIGALADAWIAQGRPPRLMVVIVELALPLTADQAKAKHLTAYEQTGRPASWDRAQPVLLRAIGQIDEANPRAVDSAVKAADAMAEARRPEMVPPLIELASRPPTKKLIAAQITAVRALGRFVAEQAKVVPALAKLVDREPPKHPRLAADKDQARTLEEAYGLHLAVTGAAVNAISDLRTPLAIESLIRALYVTPELFSQLRRALVASGPKAEQELLKTLRGEDADVEQLFKTKKLGTYCGEHGDATCQPVSAHDFYPSVVLGDFYDPATVPDLLAALKRPPLPVYYADDQPGGSTQYNAIFDALRKIGAPAAADPVRSMWSGKPSVDLATRVLAISAYPFVTRDAQGVAELGKIAADNTADDALRQEAASAFARLSRDPKDIALLQQLAQRYVDASAKKAKEAEIHKKEIEVADAALAGPQKALDKAKNDLIAITKEPGKSAQEITAATDRAKQADAAYREAKKKHAERTRPFREASVASRAYRAYARMFQTHIARIDVAVRCKTDLGCFAASLSLRPEAAAQNVAKYVKDIASWTAEDKAELVAAVIERSLLEIGKQGTAATQLTDALLDAAASEQRLVRQSVLLALPKVATLPCAPCETKLEAAIEAGEGKAAIADLQLETAVLRNYFSWAGGRQPAHQ